MDNQKPISDRLVEAAFKCAHKKVVHYPEPVGDGMFRDKWRCYLCEKEFMPVPNFDPFPQKIQVMPPMATLRDQFAMAALTGMLADENVHVGGTYDAKTAELCYGIADAMMEARKQ